MRLFCIELNGGNREWIVAKDLVDAATAATKQFGSRVESVQARTGVIITYAVRGQIASDWSRQHD